jgi:hypothetical protein
VGELGGKDIQQWTIRMSRAWIDDLKAVAYERRVHPSALVEEWVWPQAYRDRSPSAAVKWNTVARPVREGSWRAVLENRRRRKGATSAACVGIVCGIRALCVDRTPRTGTCENLAGGDSMATVHEPSAEPPQPTCPWCPYTGILTQVLMHMESAQHRRWCDLALSPPIASSRV